MLNKIDFENFYKGKKVFLTGHTGFKGSWLHLWLKMMGAEVLGYSLKPETKLSLFEILENGEGVLGNILNSEFLNICMQDFKPDIVFHLAAQPLVRRSYREPVLTYQTNVIGTLNVLEAARKCTSVKAFVNVTTDKCYENKEIEKAYKETDSMGGYDLYSSSKGCVEIMSSSYRRSFLSGDEGFALACARAGNVIGGGDWAEDRLVPDCIRAINRNENIEIRNPITIRPWQHVLEPLSGYLLLGQKLFKNGKKYAEGFNFGPESNNVLKVSDVVQKVVQYYGKGEVVICRKDDLHEAELLMLDIEKAKSFLNWHPRLSADDAIKNTVEWYKKYYENANIREFSRHQIEDYVNGKSIKENK